MEIVPYGGWNSCARIQAGGIEALVTLEVGPRIIRYGLIGGPNELVEYAKDMGKTGGDEYRSYGGHRLWIAPEEDPKTLHADNALVEAKEEGGWHVFTAPVSPNVAKSFPRARLASDGSVEHLAPAIAHPGGDWGYPVFTELGTDLVAILEDAGFQTELRFGPISDDDFAQVYVCRKP